MGVAVMDPSFATARHVDELTDEALPGLPMTDVDRVEADLLTQLDAATEIVERIMTMHWDMAACRCWVCSAGRDAGCRPREKYLDYLGRFAFVRVDMDRRS